ncbi:MAG: hypothetical protein NTW87_26215 [Planctomycetota bacterium]|nr:hypothetical protein [Planctomycetota bacterium]
MRDQTLINHKHPGLRHDILNVGSPPVTGPCAAVVVDLLVRLRLDHVRFP